VADALHRAGGGNRRGNLPRVHHGGRRTATAATAAATSGQGPGGASAADGRAGRERGQAPPPALLSGSRMGLGGGRLCVHGALAQSRAATVVRRPGEGRGAQVPGRHLRQDR